MKKWMLDDGAFGLLGRHFNAGWKWPAGGLHLSESVAAAASADRSGRRQKLLAMKAPGRPCFEVHPILAGSPVAEMVFQHLRPNAAVAKRDLGEDEAIALCALKLRDVVFVTMDKGAAYQALVELGPGQVSSPFDLWVDLRDGGLISQVEFVRLCGDTVKADGGIVGVPRRI